MSNWDILLNNTKLSDLAQKDIFKLEASRPLKDALKILKDNKILSVPLHEGDNSNKILGFVDVLDISAYALKLFRKNSSYFFQRDDTKFSKSSMGKQFFDTPLRELIDYSGRNKFIQIEQNKNLADAIKLLNAKKNRAHRLAITGNNGEFVGLITQSDIARFLHKHIDGFMLSDRSLEELNLIKTCLMVRYDRPLIETLDLLVNNKVSGIALVDWEFNLVANFSASDLKGMLPDAFDLFWKPTIDFLRSGTDTKSAIPPVNCASKASLREALKNFISPEADPSHGMVHRLFITRDKNRLEGICTLTDVVSLVSESLTPRQGNVGVQS